MVRQASPISVSFFSLAVARMPLELSYKACKELQLKTAKLCKQPSLSTEVRVSIQLQLQGLSVSRDSVTCSMTLQQRGHLPTGGGIVEGRGHSLLPPTYLLCNEPSAQ